MPKYRRLELLSRIPVSTRGDTDEIYSRYICLVTSFRYSVPILVLDSLKGWRKTIPCRSRETSRIRVAWKFPSLCLSVTIHRKWFTRSSSIRRVTCESPRVKTALAFWYGVSAFYDKRLLCAFRFVRLIVEETFFGRKTRTDRIERESTECPR